MSLASIARKNLPREESEKKRSGHKINIIFCINDIEYFGAETYTDEDSQNSKPISYKQKLFREMKDQLDRLLKKLKFTKESIKKVKNIVLHGMTHGGNYEKNLYQCFFVKLVETNFTHSTKVLMENFMPCIMMWTLDIILCSKHVNIELEQHGEMFQRVLLF